MKQTGDRMPKDRRNSGDSSQILWTALVALALAVLAVSNTGKRFDRQPASDVSTSHGVLAPQD